MKLVPFQNPTDVSVAVRDELFVVASLLSTAAGAADWKFQGREEEASALIYAAQGKVDEILAAIADALTKADEAANGEGA